MQTSAEVLASPGLAQQRKMAAALQALDRIKSTLGPAALLAISTLTEALPTTSAALDVSIFIIIISICMERSIDRSIDR